MGWETLPKHKICGPGHGEDGVTPRDDDALECHEGFNPCGDLLRLHHQGPVVPYRQEPIWRLGVTMEYERRRVNSVNQIAKKDRTRLGRSSQRGSSEGDRPMCPRRGSGRGRNWRNGEESGLRIRSQRPRHIQFFFSVQYHELQDISRLTN
ncbi:uncharacterized protein M421DRAFT_337531 [Didymella exigua CBS 183.55]|uniref:Uncharacterized protein n=1 Tax=Didymella exigua CBS 183.55 TaxID=1150837 RepID=A0A6A5R6J6_9PLEO|nr:uncharacterized protein M421DRAFT_337531 [Didymella exigua CBS 183.55]KAF1922818.1 hypothetical protein M421DRAFT_337531 [Didymella exigua CBS 183.55]